jgi:endonuclease YncB( thermonuclease family)
MSIMSAILICLSPTAYDGDTIRCGDSVTRVRLFGVNAVEVGQPGWMKARDALQKRIAGGLMCEPQGASYARTVAICYEATGRDVGLEVLKVDHVVTEWCAYSKNFYGTCAAVTPK